MSRAVERRNKLLGDAKATQKNLVLTEQRLKISFRSSRVIGKLAARNNKLLKGLILAQNERWRRGLGMQVEGMPARAEPA